MPNDPEQLVNAVNALLPQTQCTKCGYNGCKPYAHAIVHEQAPINRCPPGGQAGIEKLAALLNRPVLPLDETRGQHVPLQVAVIDEAHCIGCTLCIQACPVDAIVGANKLMHTILEDQCTGCELCVDPCPVDCIAMVDANREWTTADAQQAKANYDARQHRLQQQHAEPSGLAARTLSNKAPLTEAAYHDQEERQETIASLLERARARRHHQ